MPQALLAAACFHVGVYFAHCYLANYAHTDVEPDHSNFASSGLVRLAISSMIIAISWICILMVKM